MIQYCMSLVIIDILLYYNKLVFLTITQYLLLLVISNNIHIIVYYLDLLIISNNIYYVKYRIIYLSLLIFILFYYRQYCVNYHY